MLFRIVYVSFSEHTIPERYSAESAVFAPQVFTETLQILPN